MALGILSGANILGTIGADDGIADRVTDVAPIDPTTGMDAYPWMAYSPRTKSLQGELAVWLKANGYESKNPDGILGAGTCGFLKFAQTKKFGWAPPDTCKSFGPDPKCTDTSKCGAVAVPRPPVHWDKPVVVPVTPYTPPEPKKMSMAALGGIAAAVAVVGYFVAKKKGWIH